MQQLPLQQRSVLCKKQTVNLIVVHRQQPQHRQQLMPPPQMLKEQQLMPLQHRKLLHVLQPPLRPLHVLQQKRPLHVLQQKPPENQNR